MSKPEANLGRGKKKGVYHFIQELIQEGKYAWFVNQEGRFRIKWEIAVERYIEYRAKKNPKYDLSIDRRMASNSFREALLHRYCYDADGAKEYEECRTVGEKNKIVEREFQMPSTVFHSLFGPSEELPSDQFETSGISVRVSESTQGIKKGVYHLIQELIQEGKYAWFVNQEGRFRIKWEIAVERYIEYRAKKNRHFDLSIDRRKASNSFREALLRYWGDADGAKEYKEFRTVGEKNTIVEREFQMPSTVFHLLFGPSEELPSDQESSSEDRSDSGFETCNIPQETSLSRSKIGDSKDSTSLEEVTSILKDKQQTEEQRREYESESFEETLNVNLATSPSMVNKGKDSTSPEEVISVPVDKQQTEEQSAEDESESSKETLSVGPATSPSTIDKGKDSTSLEEVISVPVEKQQTEEQSGEDESESFKETLSVGSAQEHDIKGRTITFEAMRKECIRVLPYENTSGQVYVQLYVFCDKNDIPKELEAAAQEFFGETGVELRWTNLYNYASNKPNIVTEDFKQLEVTQVNDISNIINRNLPVFSKHRNITAIKPSLKVTNSKQTNDPCIRVYVLGKRCLPVGESEIPNAVENCPVDIVDGFWLETSDTKPLMAHKQGKYLRLGASIGVRGKNEAGTLGAIVKDDDGGFYLLSCDHVMRERERQIIHPGKCHYRNSLEYHLLGYHNWINRILKKQDTFQENHRDPAEYFRQLERKVDSFYLGKYRHPKLRECERKLRKLISEPPRTVAHFIDGIRENVGERYIDVAVAKLTNEEIEALKRNGYVEIIDTTDYPDGNVTRDESGSVREWRKSGCTSGYTSLKNRVLVDNGYLRHSASGNPLSMLGSSVYAERVMSDAVWCKKCMILSHIDDSFACRGDSGTVIFEKSGPQPQAMPGFGIIIGFIVDMHDRCVETIAIPLGIALDHLSEKLSRRLTLVSAL